MKSKFVPFHPKENDDMHLELTWSFTQAVNKFTLFEQFNVSSHQTLNIVDVGVQADLHLLAGM